MDENLRQISAALDVTIFRRGEKFIVSGTNAARAVAILEHFYTLADDVISIDEIQLALVEQRATLANDGDAVKADIPSLKTAEQETDNPVLKTRRNDLRGRTPHQNQYIKSILEHDITFGIGP